MGVQVKAILLFRHAAKESSPSVERKYIKKINKQNQQQAAN